MCCLAVYPYPLLFYRLPTRPAESRLVEKRNGKLALTAGARARAYKRRSENCSNDAKPSWAVVRDERVKAESILKWKWLISAV